MNRKSPDPNHGVIRGDQIQRAAQPVVIECAQEPESGGTLSVVPVMDGDLVAGLEIRCSCGTSAIVECVYPQEEVS